MVYLDMAAEETTELTTIINILREFEAEIDKLLEKAHSISENMKTLFLEEITSLRNKVLDVVEEYKLDLREKYAKKTKEEEAKIAEIMKKEMERIVEISRANWEKAKLEVVNRFLELTVRE